MKSYIFLILLLILISVVYFYKLMNRTPDKLDERYFVLKDYVITETVNVFNVKKPILWIHVHNDNNIIPTKNSRYWLDFYSRNTDDLNMPYLYLTIKSIINKCVNDFNVCLIDDESFGDLIPSWNVDLNKIALPIKNHLRHLGLAKVLYKYGGLLYPQSIIGLRSPIDIYNEAIEDNKILIGEFANKTKTSNEENFLVSPELIGCNFESPIIKKYINYLEQLYSNDFVAESDFLGTINQYLSNEYKLGNARKINGCMIGTKTDNGKRVFKEDLLGSSFFGLVKNAYGLYIPWDDILNSQKYQWFARLSYQQVLESDTMIGKYLLYSN